MATDGQTITVAITAEGYGSGKYAQAELYNVDTGAALSESPLSLTYLTATTEDYTGNFVYPTGASAVKAVARLYDDASFGTQTFASGVANQVFERDKAAELVSKIATANVVGLVDTSSTVVGLVDSSVTVLGLVE